MFNSDSYRHQSTSDATKHMQLLVCTCDGHLSCASSFRIQYGNTALLLAAVGGSVEMARMLLDEFGSTVDEVGNVSTVFTTLGAVRGGVRLWSHYSKVTGMVVFTVMYST